MTAVNLDGLLGATAGACLVAGVFLVVLGLVGTTAPAPPRPSRLPFTLPGAWLGGASRVRGDAGDAGRTQMLRRVQWLAAPVAGLVVWLISGWVVAGLIAAAVILAAPGLFGTSREAREAMERMEALQAWTRRLADLRTAGGGLEQTLAASLKTCPDPIRPHVTALVARLRSGWRIDAALRAFADDLADPAADLVVTVLVLDAERRGTGVAGVLDDLADTVAEEVAMRRKVEADRAKPRTSARIVTVITLGAAGIGVFNPTYIQPYGSPLGQVVLAGIAVGIAVCLWWMRRVATGAPDTRFLAESDRGGNPAGPHAGGREVTRS